MCHVRIFVLQQRRLKSSLNDVTLRHQHWDHLNLKAFWIPRIVLPQAQKTDAKFKRQICHSHSHGCDHFHSQSAHANQGTLTKRSPWNVRRLWCPCHGLRAEQAFSFVAATSVTSLCSELERNGSKWSKMNYIEYPGKRMQKMEVSTSRVPGFTPSCAEARPLSCQRSQPGERRQQGHSLSIKSSAGSESYGVAMSPLVTMSKS